MFEAGKNVRPHQGALAALEMARESLSSFPKCADGRTILEATKNIERPVDAETVVAIRSALRSLQLPSKEQLSRRSPVTSLVLRVVRSFEQAVLAELKGDEVRAWRCVATAALEAGACMAAAIEQEKRRASGAAKTGSQGILKVGLKMLVDKGFTNSQIFGVLSDIDKVSTMAVHDAFPIEVCEPSVEDWTLHSSERFSYFKTGRSEADVQHVKVKRVHSALSELRRVSRKASKSG